MVAEDALDGDRLGLVADRRRRAVRVDVLDLLRLMLASLSARCMTRIMPLPSSDGEVMWYASLDIP